MSPQAPDWHVLPLPCISSNGIWSTHAYLSISTCRPAHVVHSQMHFPVAPILRCAGKQAFWRLDLQTCILKCIKQSLALQIYLSGDNLQQISIADVCEKLSIFLYSKKFCIIWYKNMGSPSKETVRMKYMMCTTNNLSIITAENCTLKATQSQKVH
jgi:hypothetical protein